MLTIGQAADETTVACTCINLVIFLGDLISGGAMNVAVSKFAECQKRY